VRRGSGLGETGLGLVANKREQRRKKRNEKNKMKWLQYYIIGILRS